uniref:Virion structural protein n=1 Tax=Pseudomonas phage RVTF4 TaxID=3236931 RepID=A0AB39CD69_9VIRU
MQYAQPQMMQQPQQMLAGIVYNVIDQSSFNPNLPQGNDLQIQVQPSQWLQNPQSQQMLGLAVGMFRQRMQERANRSFLHTWAYNRLSQNRFQNQHWQTWVNHLYNFLEFISVVQGQSNPPNAAPGKAADTMYKCYVAQCVAEHPQLMNFLVVQGPQGPVPDQNSIGEIQKYSQLLGAIMQDTNAYRNGSMMAPQQVQQYQQPYPQYMQAGQVNVSMGGSSPGQLPPVNMMQYNQQPQYQAQRPAMGLSSMTVGQHIQTNQPLPVQSVSNSGGGSTGMDYGVPAAPEPMPVASPNPPAVMQPTESYGVTLAPISPVPVNPQTQMVATMPVEELDRPIPMSAAEVILDPHYYVPDGVEVDLERPFDTIYSPGGVITRPAYQVDWTVTRNDTHVYTQMVDPTRFIRFYTQWPDGVVQERIEEITEMMDYMRHEINPDLKAAAHRPNGEVVLTQLQVHKTITDMLPLAEVKELQLADEAQPVRLVVDFQGTTDMENEVEARRVLRKELGLDTDVKLPSHEYGSTRTHLIEIDEATFEELLGHLDTNDLQQIAKDLALMQREGKLGNRVFKFIDARLTNEVNSYLKDVLSQDVSIDHFTADINDLFDYVAQNLGEKYVKLLKEGAQTILARSLQLAKTEDEGDVIYSINDNFINLQTGWMMAELTDAKVDDEAQLVSKYTHAALIEAIKTMLGRATPAERILRRFRVVTLDGAYLEIFRGKLVENAFMFKRTA